MKWKKIIFLLVSISVFLWIFGCQSTTAKEDQTENTTATIQQPNYSTNENLEKEYPYHETRQEMARNNNTLPETLAKLANDSDHWVKEIVAHNKNTPVEILIKLAGDKYPSVKAAVARNKKTPINILKKFAYNGEVEIRISVADNPNTPPWILAILANDSDSKVKDQVTSRLSNFGMSGWDLKSLRNENPNLSNEEFDRLFHKIGEEKKKQKQKNDQEKNKQLAQKRQKARDPKTSTEELTQLAKESDYSIRCAVAINPNTSLEVLAKLVYDKNSSVQQAVAENPKTIADILAALVTNQNTHIKKIVAKNPNSSTAILSELAKDKEKEVRLAVAQSPNSSDEVLAILINDSEVDIKLALLQNSNISSPTIEKMTLDKNVQVKITAKQKLGRLKDAKNPPQVVILSPLNNPYKTSSSTVRITAKVQYVLDQNDVKLKVAKKTTNISPKKENKGNAIILSWDIDIAKGKNHLEIIALNSYGEALAKLIIDRSDSYKTLTKSVNRALIIANSQYRDATGSWKSLQTPGADGQALKDVLENNYGFSDITYIQNASRERIYQALRSLLKKSKKDDQVLIFYAGHGHLDEVTGYWIPVDARGGDDSTFVSNEDIKRRAVALSVKCKHVLLISDSCFSGNLMSRGVTIEAPDNYNDYYQKKSRYKSCQVISSGGNEYVDDKYLNSGHSPFAYFFINKLKLNREKYLSASSISLYLEKTVANAAQQTPEHGRLKGAQDEAGEFFFTRTK